MRSNCTTDRNASVKSIQLYTHDAAVLEIIYNIIIMIKIIVIYALRFVEFFITNIFIINLIINLVLNQLKNADNSFKYWFSGVLQSSFSFHHRLLVISYVPIDHSNKKNESKHNMLTFQSRGVLLFTLEFITGYINITSITFHVKHISTFYLVTAFQIRKWA